MIVEKLAGQNPVNIKDVNIAAPEKKTRPFNPLVDATDRDVWGLHELLNDFRRNDIVSFIQYAGIFKRLFPNKEKDLGIDDRFMNNLIHEFRLIFIPGMYAFEDGHTQYDQYDLIQTLSYAKDLSPKGVLTIKDDYRYIYDYIYRLQPCTNDRGRSSLASSKLLNQNEADWFPIDINVWTRLKDDYELTNSTDDKISILYSTRILYPERFTELTIHESFWEESKKILESCKRDNAYAFFWKAAEHLAVVAADEVKITDQGMKLTFEKKQLQPAAIPQLPEVRKF